MDLHEQIALFEQDAELAYERVLQLLMDYRPMILAKARERLISGFYEFGEASWHKQPNQLLEETLQELADAPVYQVMQMHRERVGDEPADLWEEYGQGPDIVFDPDPQLTKALNTYSPDD